MFTCFPNLECHWFSCLLSVIIEFNRMYHMFPPWQSDVPEGVIRIHAPLLSKVSMAIQLNSQTKAKDILAKFQYENRWVEVNMSLCTGKWTFIWWETPGIWKFDLFENLEPVTLRTSPVNEESEVEKEVDHRIISNKSFFSRNFYNWDSKIGIFCPGVFIYSIGFTFYLNKKISKLVL